MVKLAPQAGQVVERALKQSRAATRTGLAWFDALNARYGARAIQPVFPTASDADTTTQKPPERARRLPSNAAIPTLRYISKLALRPGVDLHRAVAEYAAHPDVQYAEPNRIAVTQ